MVDIILQNKVSEDWKKKNRVALNKRILYSPIESNTHLYPGIVLEINLSKPIYSSAKEKL